MWGKIMIPMYRLWLHGLYGLYGPRCPMSPERLLNLITHSLDLVMPFVNSDLFQDWIRIWIGPARQLIWSWLVINKIMRSSFQYMLLAILLISTINIYSKKILYWDYCNTVGKFRILKLWPVNLSSLWEVRVERSITGSYHSNLAFFLILECQNTEVISKQFTILISFWYHTFLCVKTVDSTWPSNVLWPMLRPRQNGRHFTDYIFKCVFLNEDIWILIDISLKFVPKGPINNIPALVQIMAWRRPGDKPLSEPMMMSIYASLGLNELNIGPCSPCNPKCYFARQHWVKSAHWGQEKMANILQITFSNAFSGMKTFDFQVKFHWYNVP